jgi:hypothetical protein
LQQYSVGNGVTVDNQTYVDTEFITQNDLQNNILKGGTTYVEFSPYPRAGKRRQYNDILGTGRCVFLLFSRTSGLVLRPTLITFCKYRVSFQRVNPPGHEFESLPSKAEFKNQWSYIPTSHTPYWRGQEQL